MISKEIATIQFRDADSGDQVVAIIRCVEDKIGLSLSLETDGDIEVFLKYEDCEDLLKALQQAVSIVGHAL